jgi:hypothetical protein
MPCLFERQQELRSGHSMLCPYNALCHRFRGWHAVARSCALRPPYIDFAAAASLLLFPWEAGPGFAGLKSG